MGGYSFLIPRIIINTNAAVSVVLLWLYVTVVIGTFATIYKQLYLGNPAGLHVVAPVNGLTFWYYSIATFTTTGYGDIYAQSNAIRLVAMIEMIVGWATGGVILGLLVSKIASSLYSGGDEDKNFNKVLLELNKVLIEFNEKQTKLINGWLKNKLSEFDTSD